MGRYDARIHSSEIVVALRVMRAELEITFLSLSERARSETGAAIGAADLPPIGKVPKLNG